MENNGKEVALVTVYYREEYMTSLVFSDTATADEFVGMIQRVFRHRGEVDLSFRSGIRTVYDARKIQDELSGTLDSTQRPQEILMRILRIIARREAN